MLHHLKRWDRSLLLWMQEHLRKGGVTLFMKITTFLGNGGIIWIAACLCLLFRPEARRAAASGWWHVSARLTIFTNSKS